MSHQSVASKFPTAQRSMACRQIGIILGWCLILIFLVMGAIMRAELITETTDKDFPG